MNYDDVYDFHQKFNLIAGTKPQQLTSRKLKERLEFLWEELHEFALASGITPGKVDSHGKLSWDIESYDGQPVGKDIDDQADALIDLVYVAMGTAVMMGLPWEQLWDDVHRANMEKVRGMTKRGHSVDVTKPEGWVGPDAMSILKAYGFDPDKKEVDDGTLV